MCLMFDAKPKWYRKEDWDRLRKKYVVGVYYDGSEPEFDQITTKNADRMCPISEILKEDSSLSKLADDYGFKWSIDKKEKLMDVLHDVRRNIRDYEVKCYIIPKRFSDFAHVAEIFERINKGGVEVKISDVVITRIVGRVWRGFKDDFDQFVKDLIKDGYITDAEKYRSGILQIFSAIAEPRDPKLESLLRKSFSDIKNTWSKTKTIIYEVFEDVKTKFGITPKDLGDIKPFIVLCRLYDKFGANFKANLPFVFRWFILRIARAYGGFGPAMTDLVKVERSQYISEAVEELCKSLSPPSIEEIRDSTIRSRISALLKILCFKTDASLKKNLKYQMIS